MRTILSAFAVMLLATACRDSNGPSAVGALDGAIVAGQSQSVKAGAARLDDAVVEEIVRVPLTGKLRLRRVRPWERVLLPPLAWAQTVVRGSPVPGAVVCVSEQDKDLIPFARCTNTGTDGRALFFFSPTTKAGSYIARINGVVGDEATTFDTVKATVLPDVADPNYRTGVLPLRCSPATFPADGARDKYGNAVPFRIVPDGRLTVVGDTVGTVAARTVTYTAAQSDPPNQTNYYRMELRGADGSLVGRLQYRIGTGTGGCGDGTSGLQIDWTAAGVALMP